MVFKEAFFHKDAPKRILADMPIIFFSIVVAGLTQYFISSQSISLVHIFAIILVPLVTMAIFFFIYCQIHEKINEVN